MIGFEKLALFSGAEDGFVGIRKHLMEKGKRPRKEVFKPQGWEVGADFAFYLPHGFEDFPKPEIGDEEQTTTAYNTLRDTFFCLYRAFCKFERDNVGTGRLNKQADEKQDREDQTLKSPGGISMENLKGDDCILYSKLKNIERIFYAYSDLAMNALERKHRRTQDVDYSQIHKYLDRAIYLDDGTIYVDEMNLPKATLLYETTDLILLYSYILDEILFQLQEDIQDSPFAEYKVADMIRSRRQHIRELSENFRDKFLSPTQSLFDAKTHPETISILKETLEKIDQVTPYKDSDYWQLFEAVEAFLYGELNPDDNDGDYWGIKGFSLLWEDICHTYYFRKQKTDILYADTDVPIPSLGNNNNRDSEITELDRTRVGTVRVGSRNKEESVVPGSYWVYAINFGAEEKIVFFQKKDIDLPLHSEPPKIDCYSLSKIDKGISYLAKGARKASTFVDYLTLYFDQNFGDLQPKNIKNARVTRLWARPDYECRRVFIRKLHPDLVLKINHGEKTKIRIIDYKDIPLDIFNHNTEKIKQDVRKSLVYEFALQQSFTVQENVFLLPWHSSDDTQPEIRDTKVVVNTLNGIKIYQAHFGVFMKEYLDESRYAIA